MHTAWTIKNKSLAYITAIKNPTYFNARAVIVIHLYLRTYNLVMDSMGIVKLNKYKVMFLMLLNAKLNNNYSMLQNDNLFDGCFHHYVMDQTHAECINFYNISELRKSYADLNKK